MVSAVCQFFGCIGGRFSWKLRAYACYFAPSTLMAPTSRFLDRDRCGDSIQLRCEPISSLSYLAHSRGCAAEVSCRPPQLIQFNYRSLHVPSSSPPPSALSISFSPPLLDRRDYE